MDLNTVYTIAVGTGYDSQGNVLTQKRVNEALDAFRLSLVSIAGGFTETQGKGMYTHANGDMVTEPSAVFTVAIAEQDDVKRSNLMRAIIRVRDALQQESVYVQRTHADIEFI